MEITPVTRLFQYAGMTLRDPNPALTVEGVRAHFARFYPELNNATVTGPVVQTGNMVFTFQRAAGAKA